MTPTIFQYLGLIAIGLFAGLVIASARQPDQPSTQSEGSPREETESSDVQ